MRERAKVNCSSLPSKLIVIVMSCLSAAFCWFGGKDINAQTVATYSFEDGMTDGWTSFNGANTPVVSNAAVYAGSYSLLTTTGATGARGPSIKLNSVLPAAATYTIAAYVLLTGGESASNANFTIARTDASCSGGTCYDTIGAYQARCRRLGGPRLVGAIPSVLLKLASTFYAQLVVATTEQSFYLADVMITETAPPPGGSPIATYTFSDGGLDGWGPFGSTKLTNRASHKL